MITPDVTFSCVQIFRFWADLLEIIEIEVWPRLWGNIFIISTKF